MKTYRVIAKETFTWADIWFIEAGKEYVVRPSKGDERKEFWDVFDPINFKWEIEVFRHRFTRPVNRSKGPISK